jgi:hypothetical protein
MKECVCGSTQIVAEAHLIAQRGPDGETLWVGQELLGVKCARCSRDVVLDAHQTIELMHYLIERRYAEQVSS